jgi:hypothetical protein
MSKLQASKASVHSTFGRTAKLLGQIVPSNGLKAACNLFERSWSSYTDGPTVDAVVVGAGKPQWEEGTLPAVIAIETEVFAVLEQPFLYESRVFVTRGCVKLCRSGRSSSSPVFGSARTRGGGLGICRCHWHIHKLTQQ